MQGNCDNRNEYVRTGVSQQERVLAALLPTYAQVDERNYADLILFAKEYARYLNYFNDQLVADKNAAMDADGDWTVFMKMDISVVLATLSKLDSKKVFAYFDFLLNKIQQTESGEIILIKDYYKAIFEFVYSIVYWLDEAFQKLPLDFSFTEFCGNIIQSRLNELYWRITEYYEQSSIANLISTDIPYVVQGAPIEISAIQKLEIQKLSHVWDFIPATTFAIQIEGNSDSSKIKYISQHSIFKGTIEQLLKNIISVTQKASAALEETINFFPTHSPHYALFLTFIKLFKYSQNYLNEYTENHLNFYYKNILQLKKLNPSPDSVHLVLELAKQTDSHLIVKGTTFKAGKDVDGIDIFYSATQDVVLNKGNVSNIKSVFTEKIIDNTGPHLKIFSAPVTNSGDGKGGEITTTDKSWKPFGDTSKNDLARTGFSISHAILFLKEGKRTITITFNCNDISALKPYEKNIKDWFIVRGTSVKGWTDIPIIATAVFLYGKNQIVFQLQLTNDKPAIVPYDEKVHQANYATDLPLVEFAINTALINHDPHLFMQLVIVNNITIHVDAEGIKDVSIQNELNSLDTAKPFELWGPQPHIGSSFIIGSKEIFLKNNDSEVKVTVNLEWDKTDDLNINTTDIAPNGDWYFANKNIYTAYLHSGEWSNITDNPPQVFFKHQYPATHNIGKDGIEYHVHLDDSVEFTLPRFTNQFDFTENIPYTINSSAGYMKIMFMGPIDFGHSDYIQRFTDASLRKITSPSITLPPKPYTPTVKSISINYSATAGIDFSFLVLSPLISIPIVNQNSQLSQLSKVLIPQWFFPVQNIFGNSISGMKVSNMGSAGNFYHLYPFGHSMNNGSSINLLPALIIGGQIFIGIEQFNANQSIQILFQLSEGSANPLKEKQNINWSYLTLNNTWKNFEDKAIDDSTNDLTQTGIIKFSFPYDATSNTSLFTEQIFWIRGVVLKDTDAICNIIQLHAQSIKTIFTDYLNKNNYFKNILSASVISKLAISDFAIKKIIQPYNSFGGRTTETDKDFYARISERLRHKNRGITMWDYERIILQHFPAIYKVKCINHSAITLNPDSTETDNEIKPGHIVIVTVPDLHNKNAVDILKPMTSIGLLNNIYDFLKKIISPFIQLQVKNARFEEIQLDFKVKFRTDDGSFYHDVLNDEIVEFLTPWAFGLNTDFIFGGTIYKSALLDFVEERPYVDFVTCFKMYSWIEGIRSGDIEEATASSARSVFVSFGHISSSNFEKRHLIDYVNQDCNC